MNKHIKNIFFNCIENHPKFIYEKLNNLEENQFGFSAFGLKNNTKFDYLEFPREIKKKYF